ncbi:MAG: serine/threonine protein kinase [Deltaproteobacteria bacterium]|nr:serine/threonine protein kinase [Deltaproteobacteria bacterium]
MPNPSQPSGGTTRFEPGATLGGKFRIERVLGEGGMGTVVEATNIRLDERVALKLLRADAERSAETVEAFTREVRAASKLRSEHVARVLDVGEDPSFGPYMVMELLEGSTLQDVLKSTGRLSPQRAIEYCIMACEALSEAHARGIVHRDIKPGNLFVVRGPSGRPIVKVLDFGIATVTLPGPIPEGSSSTGRAAHGSPHYLSPEQLRSPDAVGPRADVWAVGCVLFELLTGVKAFDAPRFTALVAKILEAPPSPIPEDVELPEGLHDVLRRALEKDQTARYDTVAELALALLPFARARAHSTVVRAVAHVRDAGLAPDLVMPSSMPPPPSGNDLASSQNIRVPSLPRISIDGYEQPPREAPSQTEQTPRRSPLLFVVAAAAVVAIIIGLAAMRRLGRSDEQTKAPPSTTTSAVGTSLAKDPGPMQTAAPSTEPRAPIAPASTDAGATQASAAARDAASPDPAPSASSKAKPPVNPWPPANAWPPKLATTAAPTPTTSPPAESEIRSTR